METLKTTDTLGELLEMQDRISQEMSRLSTDFDLINSQLTDLIEREKLKDISFKRFHTRKEYISYLKASVSVAMGVEQSLILTRTRKREIVQARQVLAWLCTKKTDWALASIGRFIAADGLKFDHATVLHSRNKIDDQLYLKNNNGASVEEWVVIAEDLCNRLASYNPFFTS